MKLNINTIEKDFVKCEIKDEYLKFKYNQNVRSKLKLTDAKYNSIIDPFNNQEFSNEFLFKGAMRSINEIKAEGIKPNIKLEKILNKRDIKCNFTKMLSELKAKDNFDLKHLNLKKIKCFDSNSSETLENIGETLIKIDNNKSDDKKDNSLKFYKTNVKNNPFLNEGDLFRLVHRDKKIKKLIVMKKPRVYNIKEKDYINFDANKELQTKNKQTFSNITKSQNLNFKKSKLFEAKNDIIGLEINTKSLQTQATNKIDKYNEINSGRLKLSNNKDEKSIKLSSSFYITDKIDLKENNYELKLNKDRYDYVKFFTVDRNTFFKQKNI